MGKSLCKICILVTLVMLCFLANTSAAGASLVMKKVRVGKSWDNERLSVARGDKVMSVAEEKEEEASATDYAPPRKKTPIHN